MNKPLAIGQGWTSEDAAILQRLYGAQAPGWAQGLQVRQFESFDWRTLAGDWRDGDAMAKLTALRGVPPACRATLLELGRLE